MYWSVPMVMSRILGTCEEDVAHWRWISLLEKMKFSRQSLRFQSETNVALDSLRTVM